jgi:predicted transcriptional regulator of viral defense system
MEFEELLQLVAAEPLFETGLLLAGDVDPAAVRKQLSRWTAAGRIYQLRRGLYALAPPYQAVAPHPFLVANRLLQPSYVSLQAALAHYGLIPEYVAVVTSVTSRRPGAWETPLGRYAFRHLKQSRFFGYHRLQVADGQHAFVATPEKALLDLIYLEPGADDPMYLAELRLQNLERLDLDRLRQQVKRAESPKLARAAQVIRSLAEEEEGYELI